jgi:hypothetical protein
MDKVLRIPGNYRVRARIGQPAPIERSILFEWLRKICYKRLAFWGYESKAIARTSHMQDPIDRLALAQVKIKFRALNAGILAEFRDG